jgi:bacterioferritin
MTRFNRKPWTRFHVDVLPRRRRGRLSEQSPLSFRGLSPIVESTGRELMAKPKLNGDDQKVSRDRLAELLNEDLSREYQAIISYVVYSQVLKGAEFMSIAGQLKVHAQQELKHALIISKQIDYLGKMPTVTAKPVRTSEKAKDMLRFDLENENETSKNYRARVRQCEALGEFAMAELIRQILVDEQDHQIDLATALGVEVPDVSG